MISTFYALGAIYSIAAVQFLLVLSMNGTRRREMLSPNDNILTFAENKSGILQQQQVWEQNVEREIFFNLSLYE